VSGLLWMRWVFVALVGGLGLLLISRHDDLIGGFLLVITVWRVIMLAAIHRRRSQGRQRFQNRRGRWGGPNG
jgi:hypothetical protein